MNSHANRHRSSFGLVLAAAAILSMILVLAAIGFPVEWQRSLKIHGMSYFPQRGPTRILKARDINGEKNPAPDEDYDMWFPEEEEENEKQPQMIRQGQHIRQSLLHSLHEMDTLAALEERVDRSPA